MNRQPFLTALLVPFIAATSACTAADDSDGTVAQTTAVKSQPLRAADAWTRKADMNLARGKYSTVTLSDGRVMVIGGISVADDAPTPATEIYDPDADAWTPAAPTPMPVPFINVAITLSSGMVLLVGQDVLSYDGTANSLRSFLYDPRADRWIETGSLPTQAVYWGNFTGNAVEGPDGRVLVAGGYSIDSGVAPFDPATPTTTTRLSFMFTPGRDNPADGTWDFTRDAAGEATQMPSPHEGVPLIDLRDGRFLICGGRWIGNPGQDLVALSAACDLYDWSSGQWTAAAPMPAIPDEDGAGSATPGSRYRYAAHRLPDGRVLIAGGMFLTADAEFGIGVRRSTIVFDPGQPAAPWSYAPAMNMQTGRFLAVVYHQPDGQFVVAAGSDADFLDLFTTEIFDPTRMTWSTGAELPSVHPFWADDAGLPADFKVCAIATWGSTGQAQLRHGRAFLGASGWSNASPVPPKDAYVFTPGSPGQGKSTPRLTLPASARSYLKGRGVSLLQ